MIRFSFKISMYAETGVRIRRTQPDIQLDGRKMMGFIVLSCCLPSARKAFAFRKELLIRFKEKLVMLCGRSSC